jgi:uncharacterized membrane protein
MSPLLQGLVLAALATLGGVQDRGLRATLRFAGVALGIAAVAEYSAVNVMRVVRHHTRPVPLGVPVVPVLGWYTIAYAAYATCEGLLSSLSLHGRRRLVLPAATAAVATSLDLILDCYGLDRGYWQWSADGAYASHIVGPNGRRGIPVSNFVGWVAIIGATVLGADAFGAAAPRSRRPRSWVPPLLLGLYYAPCAWWALRRGSARYLLYSLLAPSAAAARLVQLAREARR